MESKDLKNVQYKNSKNFNARILIHSKYGTSQTPWPIWLFNLYNFDSNARIAEFGCGNGLLWKVNSFRINPGWDILLSDISQGMLDTARQSLGIIPNIRYKVIDLDKDITGEQIFTHVLANHMLYHLKDREPAIEKIRRMLKAKGEFYCSTIGLDNMKEMKEYIHEYTGKNDYARVLDSLSEGFSLENGEEQLKRSFKNVERIDFADSLEITETIDIVNYVFSCNNLKPGVIILPENQKDDFKAFLDKKMAVTGKLHITKSSGTFIAKKQLP